MIDITLTVKLSDIVWAEYYLPSDTIKVQFVAGARLYVPCAKNEAAYHLLDGYIQEHFHYREDEELWRRRDVGCD